jgi:hypothetical protein
MKLKYILLFAICTTLFSCKKKDDDNTSNSNGTPVTPAPTTTSYFMSLGTDTIQNPGVSTGKTGNSIFIKAQFTTGDPVCYISLYDASLPAESKTYTIIDQRVSSPLKEGQANIKYIANNLSFYATGGTLFVATSGSQKKVRFTEVEFTYPQAQQTRKGSAFFEVR